MTAGAPVIGLAQVCKRFGKTRALGPVTLALGEGESVALIGPSGCGKTTALRLMIGLLRPDEGHVSFRGEVVSPGQWPALRRRIGYVVQDGGLFPHLTAEQNLTLMARHLGWAADKLRGRCDELLTLARLPNDLLGRYPVQLSGGQRQRVALLRALFLDPDVLLLDEPLGALDPLVRAELQDDLAEVFRSLRKTVVLVTHDLAEAAFFAQRLVLLRDGGVIQEGPAAALIEQPADAFVRAFVRAQRPPIIQGVAS